MEDPHITLSNAKDALMNFLEGLQENGVGVNVSGALSIGGIHIEINDGLPYTFQ